MYIVSKKRDYPAFLFLEIAVYKANSLRIDPETIRQFYIPNNDATIIIPPELRIIQEGHQISDSIRQAIAEFESIDTKQQN